jgi:hypothetical protein
MLFFFQKRGLPNASYTASFLTGSLPVGLTFTRASAGWRFDSAGTLQQAATDAPRFDHDPVTGAVRGLLLEPARTNSIRNSANGGAVVGTL